MSQLNSAQREAVETPSGPLLVLAGAGTGKTRVITFRIARLIARGVAPARILAVTFTNKAAREMQERVTELLPRRRKERPEVSTFHSLCVRVLRRHITKLGYPRQFSIYDRNDQETVVRGVLRNLRVGNDSLRPGELLSWVSRFKNHSIDPEGAEAEAQSDQEALIGRGFRRYQEALRQSGAVDFDDLLGLTEQLFRDFPEVRKREASRFDHVLIDEYQDTNASQYRIITALAEGHRNLCVVGDDDQSIYGWRGAEVTHILSFHKNWPGARIVRLEQNYRSSAPILALANKLIANNRDRHEKVLRTAIEHGPAPRLAVLKDDDAEAKSVVRDIDSKLTANEARARDFAILFRTNEQPRSFELELRRARIPYQLIGGQSFYDRREVRDVLAYLKVLVQPTDEVALMRILNVPSRGIGKTLQEKLLKAAIAAGKPVWNVIHSGAAHVDAGASLPAVTKFRELIEGWSRKFASGSPSHLLPQFLDAVNYRTHLQATYKTTDEQQARWTAIEEVVNALAAFEQGNRKTSLGNFLQELMLDTRDDSKDDAGRRDAVTLMTLHSAKGLEFPQVYLVGLEEGILPHQRSVDGGTIDEERRLCYVGVTRARERLTLSLAASRMKWGRPRAAIPSRFLLEMDDWADHEGLAKLSARAAAAGRVRQRR